MTDRQVGGDGLNVDITPLPERRFGAEGLSVDLAPPLVGERQTDSLGITVDFTYPLGVQYGAVAIAADLVPSAAKRLGSLGLMIDYVVSLVPANAARWSGLAFEMGTASPLAYWSSGAFQTSGASPVVWVTEHFEVSP